MDINLLSQNLLILLGISAGASLTYIVFFEYSRTKITYRTSSQPPEAHREKKPRLHPVRSSVILRNTRYRLYCIIVSLFIALTFICNFTAHHFFSSGELPNNLWMFIIPTTLGLPLSILLWYKTHWPHKLLSIFICVLSLLFTFALLNNYYSFFPTLYSIFGADTITIQTSQNTSTKRATLPSGNGVRTDTLEESMYGNNSYNGTVSSFVAPGVKPGFKPQTEWVYTPAIAARLHNKVRLPVIVMLNGTPGAPDQWIDGGIKKILDDFAAKHHGITPYVFFADDAGGLYNDTECIDSPRGNVETYLTTDFPNYIKQHYNVSPNPQDWAIGGLSMGGTCSVMLALRHPNIFRVFMDYSGEQTIEAGSDEETITQLFYGSRTSWQEHQPIYLLDNMDKDTLSKMTGLFGVGSSDSPAYHRGTKTLFKHAQKAGLKSKLEIINGKHSMQTWSTLFRIDLPEVSNIIGATN